MSYIFNINVKTSLPTYKKLVLSSICLLPIMALTATPAHAQLVNTATVAGTPDAGVLDDETATESVDIYEQIEAEAETFPAINGADGATAKLLTLLISR